jgi:hypothetical protein
MRAFPNCLSGIVVAYIAALSSAWAGPLEAIEGEIREVSGGPLGRGQVQVKTDKKTIKLRTARAELSQELQRLNKMRVRLEGHSHETHFEVLGYRILKHSSGEVPQVGHFAGIELNGQYRILFIYADGNAALLPIGWAKKMRRHVGAKAWMLGEPRDGQLTPRRFGILRPKPKE